MTNGTLSSETKFRRFIANISQCAENHQTFCTKNDDYPYEYVEQLLQKHWNEYKKFFRVYHAPEAKEVEVKAYGIDIQVHERSNGGRNPLKSNFDIDQYDEPQGEDEIEMCETYDKVIYPTSGISQSGTGLYIFNTDDHKQGVHVSMCQDPDRACQDFVILRNNYKSRCKQQKIYRELLSLSPQGQPTKERFEFPASCSCVVYRE